MSKSKQTQTTNQTTNQTATTTPNVPDQFMSPWNQYASDVSALQASGQPLISGASPLQQQSFANAANLGQPTLNLGMGGKPASDGRQVSGNGGDGFTSTGGGTGTFDLAAMLGLRAGTAGANTAQTSLATATGYNPAGAAQTNGYAAQGYGASAAAPVSGYQGQGYSAAQAGPVSVAPTFMANAAQAANRNFTDVNLNGYFNPYRQEVIDTSTADFDANLGRVRAQQSAQQAANGGMRNSNNAVLSALTEGEAGRARGSLVAGLRNQGFDTASGLAQTDLGRETANNQFNAAEVNKMSMSKAQLDAQRRLVEAQLQQSGLLANMDATNSASQFGASAANQAGMFNASAGNTAALDYAGRADQAGQFGANATNQANQFGANAGNVSALDYAGRSDQAGQFGANAFNQNGQFNANSLNQGSQFNAGQQDNALARMLESAGLISNIGQAQGADNRANIGLQADLGQQQRDITNSQTPFSNLALIQQLLGGIPLDQLTGSTTSGTATTNGTNVATSNPGLGGILSGALSGAGTIGMGLGAMGWNPFGGAR